MRNAAVVMTVVLFGAVVDAATVEIPKPHLIYRSDGEVAKACKSTKRACTTVATEFFCGCVEERDGWALVPHIIATASIYTSTERFVQHELLHISDIRRSLNEYGAGLLLRSFNSEASCRAFVDGEAKMFPHVVRGIQRQTVIKRDGIEFAGPVE